MISRRSWFEWTWDALCVLSIVGIWPRFIEPRLLSLAKYTLPIPTLPKALQGIRILHLSDLHFNCYSSPSFLNRLKTKIQSLSPNLILFSGDLLSYATLSNKTLADDFFTGLSAPLGIFACLGNHDYNRYATIDSKGTISYGQPDCHPVIQGVQKVLGISAASNEDIDSLVPNEELVHFYRSHGVTLLHNETVRVGTHDNFLNLTGIGDLNTGNCEPFTAYKGWDIQAPGIVLAHNPEIYSHLTSFPGNLFLFGHTHGGQINLPFIGKRLLGPNSSLRSGLYVRDERTLFVSRGVGSTFPFRLFAPPNIALFTLVQGGKERASALTKELFEPVVQADPSIASPQISRKNEPIR